MRGASVCYSDALDGGQITWYTGKKLLNPACEGMATPTDHSHAVAVPYKSPATCGDWVSITYHGKSVSAQVVDRCATCSNNGVDVTKAVFRQLSPLDVGELTGAHVRVQ